MADPQSPNLVCLEKAEYSLETGSPSLEGRINMLEVFRAEEESWFRPSSDYVNHPILSNNLRDTIVTLMMEVSNVMELPVNCMFKAVSYMDAYLEIKATQSTWILDDPMHLAIACLFIGGGKTDTPVGLYDINFYRTREDKKKVNAFKKEIFDTMWPRRRTSMDCLKLMIEDDVIAAFVLKLTLVDHAFVKFPPTMLAITSIFVATTLSTTKPKGLTLAVTSGYELPALRECINLIFSVLENPSKGVQVKDFYSRTESETARLLLGEAA